MMDWCTKSIGSDGDVIWIGVQIRYVWMVIYGGLVYKIDRFLL